MNFEVCTEITGVTEGFATEITLVWLHPHVPHEVNMKLGRRDESLRTHGTFPFSFLTVAWSMAGAVPLTGEVAMDVTTQMHLELSVGSTFFSAVTSVHIRMLRNTFNTKPNLLLGTTTILKTNVFLLVRNFIELQALLTHA